MKVFATILLATALVSTSVTHADACMRRGVGCTTPTPKPVPDTPSPTQPRGEAPNAGTTLNPDVSSGANNANTAVQINPNDVRNRAENLQPSSGQPWMRNQAQHSWDQRASSWQSKGINNPTELQAHLDNVRANPDIQKQLSPTPTGGSRTVYGQYSDSTRTSGTVLIDNPQAQNGGTAFPNRDIYARISQLN